MSMTIRIAVFALLPTAVFARAQALVDTDDVFAAPFVRKDFSPDGKLDEQIWRDAPPIAQVRNVYSKKTLPYSADVRLAYSRTALYVGAVLMQNMQTCMFKWDQHDLPVWNDDNVELFLFVPGEEKNRLCQFVINPLGTVADLRDDNINWYAPGLKVKTERFADRCGKSIVSHFLKILSC